MYKSLCMLAIAILPAISYAADAWTVSIPVSRYDPNAPFGIRFQYTAILYLTEDSLSSREPLNMDCNTTCYIQINTQDGNAPYDKYNPDPNIPRVAFRGTTVGQALTAYYRAIGNSYIYTVNSTAPDRRNEGVEWCGAMAISKFDGGKNYITMSGGICSKIAPPNVECALKTENVDINHGTHVASSLINTPDVKEGSFRIECNQDVNVLLSVTSPDEDLNAGNSNIVGTKIRLKDNGNLLSYLSVNDQNINVPTRFRIPKNGTDFKVKSTLVALTDDVTPGPFSSFAYVTLAYE